MVLRVVEVLWGVGECWLGSVVCEDEVSEQRMLLFSSVCQLRSESEEVK